MFNQNRPDEAIERFADEEYRQDNLHVGDIEFGLHGDGVAATWAASSRPAATGVGGETDHRGRDWAKPDSNTRNECRT